ncbi:Methyltransferase [Raphanus sativus]|nr:Methyltransferase [Raphanus sativus]
MKKLLAGSNLLLGSSTFFRISLFVLISVACFFLGKHWSDDGFRRLVFFSSEPSRSPIVSLSPDFGKTYNISDLIHKTHPIPPPVASPPPLTPPPPPSTVELQVFAGAKPG